MNRRVVPLHILIAFWLVVGGIYAVAAGRQKVEINLSATAGGQMPYLVYARHVAEEGLIGHFGDRNRMPLIPVILSLVHDGNWDVFVRRGAWFAILVSMTLIAALGAVAYASLPTWPAAAFTMTMAVAVCLPQASFVQADLAFYALFFGAWWAMCGLVRRPSISRATGVGVLLALAYLTKASALLALPILVATLVARAIVATLRGPAGEAATARPPEVAPVATAACIPPSPLVAWGGTPPPASSLVDGPGHRGRGFILAATVVVIVLLGILYPYLRNNRAHFGRHFYNLNTTFFVWCDSWSQAQRFAETYAIDRQYPAAPAAEIPGPLNYWHTHSMHHIGHRFLYGLKTLGKLALERSCFKYMVVLAAGCALVGVTRREVARHMLRENAWVIVFTIALLGGYLGAYAWYVVVAYGDRFVLSLVPPVVFAMFSWLASLSHGGPGSSAPWRRFSLATLLSLAIIVLAAGEAVFAAISPRGMAPSTFTRFYYDESHEEFRRGNLREAERGFRGVVQLDPAFAPAHRELGMIALASRRFDDAVLALSRAAELEPQWADVHNSLGSALIQAGRTAEAVPALRRATSLDPSLAVAWFNLGGAHCLLREFDQARTCRTRLISLSPDLARQLDALIRASERQTMDDE